MNAWSLFFSWPDGGVWSNLIASGLCFILGFLWARRHIHGLRNQVSDLTKQHQETHQRIAELHAAYIPSPSEPANEESTP